MPVDIHLRLRWNDTSSCIRPFFVLDACFFLSKTSRTVGCCIFKMINDIYKEKWVYNGITRGISSGSFVVNFRDIG